MPCSCSTLFFWGFFTILLKMLSTIPEMVTYFIKLTKCTLASKEKHGKKKKFKWKI